MALVGLLHGFGKLLAHPLWGSQPQWAVAGESYPVGCKFAPQVGASEFFSANPDRWAWGCQAQLWGDGLDCMASAVGLLGVHRVCL
jgi:hypothetical protein